MDLGGILAVRDFNLLFAFADKARIERRRLGTGQSCINRPILFLFKGADLTLALNNQTQRNRLHPPSGNPAPDLIPQQWRNLITHETVQHPARLLRIHQVAVDLPGMLERILDRALRDLIKGHALDGRSALLLFALLAAEQVTAQFLRQMRRNGLAFAVRVRRQVDIVHAQRYFLELGENFLFAGNHHIFGFEVILDVHPKRAFGQILNVPQRSLNLEALPEILLNSFRLRRRFDDYKTLCQNLSSLLMRLRMKLARIWCRLLLAPLPAGGAHLDSKRL